MTSSSGGLQRKLIAVGIAIGCMVVALVPPLYIRATGDEVALGLEPVDPLSLFRGNYVDLRYDVEVDVPAGAERNSTVYVVFDGARPANALRAQLDPPALAAGERCIRGRYRFDDRVDFPQLEQYFVTSAQGRDLERNLDTLLGIVKTTSSCRAVLVDLTD